MFWISETVRFKQFLKTLVTLWLYKTLNWNGGGRDVNTFQGSLQNFSVKYWILFNGLVWQRLSIFDCEHVVRERSKERLCCCCSCCCYLGCRTFIKISSKLDRVKTWKNYAVWIVYSWLFLNKLIYFSLSGKINWLAKFYFPS